MGERSMRRWLSSPSPMLAAAPLPDDDDMLQEILLRLPPLPSSLPRASLVCKRWRRLLSDPDFIRRFRAFHHREPPLLGFFSIFFGDPYFTPTMDAPDRIPKERLHLQLSRKERWSFCGCRHGLALSFKQDRLEVVVWDPFTGDQRCVVLPPGFDQKDDRLAVRGGALLCCGGHAGRARIESFKLVSLRTDDELLDAEPRAFAHLYHSETGVWDDPISTLITAAIWSTKPSILVGNSLYWFLLGYHENSGILEFDLDKNMLSEFNTPVGAHVTQHSQILRMEGSRLGLAILSDLSIQLWERKANSNVGATWMLQKTIELDKLLPPIPMIRVRRSGTNRPLILIHGYDEDGSVLFVSTELEVYTIHLKSLQFKHVFKVNIITEYHPYTSFYTPGRSIDNGNSGAET